MILHYFCEGRRKDKAETFLVPTICICKAQSHSRGKGLVWQKARVEREGLSVEVTTNISFFNCKKFYQKFVYFLHPIDIFFFIFIFFPTYTVDTLNVTCFCVWVNKQLISCPYNESFKFEHLKLHIFIIVLICNHISQITTETAIMKVINDIALKLDEMEEVMMVLYDL